MLQLTEQIHLKPSPELSHLCHLSKNLYNQANFQFRQFFFQLGELISYYDLVEILKRKDCYRSLPIQTSQQILRLVIQNWNGYFKARREYTIHPEKFLGCPKPPKYKPKNGEFCAIFTNQNTRLKAGAIYFPQMLNLSSVKTRLIEYQQIRVIPKGSIYLCEIVHNVEERALGLNPDRILSIDLGLRNLITAVNNVGIMPFIVKGGMIKSINQYFNKTNARLQSINDRQGFLGKMTKQQQRLIQIRENKITDCFHKFSRAVINYCVTNDLGMIIIGYNPLWKQSIHLGAKTNQNFVQIPFWKLIRMLQYKAQLLGIRVILQEESYTSKCSFLDNEPIEFHKQFCGTRIRRGLFRSRAGILIHADVNGGYNILRKVVPNAFSNADGIADVGLHPRSLKVVI